MPDLNLLRRLARRSAPFLLACTAVLAAFELLMCAIVRTLNIPSLADQLFSSLPGLGQEALGNQFGGALTNEGMLAFAWNHPIVLALGGAAAALLGARAIAGEIETGAIELLMAQPLSRSRFMVTHVAFGMGALALMTVVAVGASAFGRAWYGLAPLGAAPALALGINFWLLLLTAFGTTLMLSAFGREVTHVAGAAFVIGIVSYLMQVVGELWSAAAFLLPWSLFTRYAPRELLETGRIPGGSLAVLAGVFAVTVAAAWWRFARRDLP